MRANCLFKGIFAASICALSLIAASKVEADQFGINNGMTYWDVTTASGPGSNYPNFWQNGNGQYSVSWNNYQGDFNTGTGWSTWFNGQPYPFPWIQIGYDCGQFDIHSANGGPSYGSFGAYGWFSAGGPGSVDTEFYIIEMSPTPPMFPVYLQQGPWGQVTTDGGTYSIYHNYFPNTTDWMGRPYEQWISIRQGNNTVGNNAVHAISLWNHFNAWRALGWNMGNYIYVDMSTEGGPNSSGAVNATAWWNQ